MFNYNDCFNQYVTENKLDLTLSFDMPDGYGTAFGTFDPNLKTVYINAERLKEAPDHEKAFYLFHELRHASQYLRPDLFGDGIVRSLRYVIQYDGACYKQTENGYRVCRLEESGILFTDLYLGQPHEKDANAYAYGRAKDLYGDSEELEDLYAFWSPRQSVPEDIYEAVFARIDDQTERRSEIG